MYIHRSDKLGKTLILNPGSQCRHPDKTAATSPILNTVDLLPSIDGIPRLPLHEVFGEAIRQGGIQDIYLPNDTHWGNAGHVIAAQTILDDLKNRGALELPSFAVSPR